MPQPKGSIPWNKGKKNVYSAETLKKMSDAVKRRHAMAKKLGKPLGFQKGHPFTGDLSKPNFFQKGHIPWNKGKHYKLSKEARDNIVNAIIGRKHSEETKRLLSEIARRRTPEQIRKAGLARRTLKHKIDESKIWRTRVEYKSWRESVFKRDNWTCQKCGAKSGNGKTIYLHPHHILNFAEYPELRFDVNNGITLCRKCHKEFHRQYGIKNNTREQLNKFLNKGRIKLSQTITKIWQVNQMKPTGRRKSAGSYLLKQLILC